MVTTWTSSTVWTKEYYPNECGYYGIHYPANNLKLFSEEQVVVLSNREYQGLTLGWLTDLDLTNKDRLVWVDTDKTEVTHGTTSE